MHTPFLETMRSHGPQIVPLIKRIGNKVPEIGYLRAKIDKNREPLIHTARGIGFRLGLK